MSLIVGNVLLAASIVAFDVFVYLRVNADLGIFIAIVECGLLGLALLGAFDDIGENGGVIE